MGTKVNAVSSNPIRAFSRSAAPMAAVQIGKMSLSAMLGFPMC